MVNFTTLIPDCDSHSPALLDLFLSSDVSICFSMAFPPLGNYDHVVVSVSIDFPNSKGDVLFNWIAYGYFCADWDDHHDLLRDVPGRIYLKLVLFLLLLNFVSRLRLKLIYVFLIVNIRSSLTHLHGFQLLVLLS